MLKKIKNSIFNTYSKRFLSSHEREHSFVNYDKAKSVFILFESEQSEENALIREFIKQLEADGKKVAAWGFVDKKELVSLVLPDFRLLNKKYTDVSGKPKAPLFQTLESMEFDLLLDLTLSPILPLRYLALHANAHFKVGTRFELSPLYDFILDIGNLKSSAEQADLKIDEKYLFEQIIFYLKRIQTKD